ncbi:UDP-glucose:undecaprenyl-phosphate glucose-1-phosphate transferase [Tsuneonella dongtanensis]|uniref:UDP-glucose:undecaprenyl-phosphate glucose-1-phosphate transferase n=1 Tax=Tsuneonella dongtanensis TaxID=692370 RepID=A0A1B2A9X2_9SPHN|nr:sugar transferase [Tsuneonella dongtanensis]ANY18878.1 UDP-glucose:undecaprenyl-phosphate glucose-1-phosphate transferase [Tsuneonella dongtanensis]
MNAPTKVFIGDKHVGGPLARSLEQRRVRYYLAMVVLDVAILLAAFALVEMAYLGRVKLLEGQLLLPLYLTLALYTPTYSIRSLQDWRFAGRTALAALALSAALLLFVMFYAKATAEFSRVIFTGSLALSAALLGASRYALTRSIRRRWGPSVTNKLLVLAGGPTIDWPNAIVIDAAESRIVPNPGDPRSLDRLGRCLLNMDRVVVSCLYEQRSQWSQALRAAGVRGEIVTDRLDELAPIGLSVEDGWRALVVSTGPLGLRQRVMKRVFDIVVATVALVVTAPIFLATAIAIKLEDGGPVLFVQRRLGRGNRFFDMLKFRSMQQTHSDFAGVRSAARDDDRVTRVGRFIRRTSIDELPQFINVLRGEMSVVGPRPHALGSQVGDKLFWEVDRQYWDRHTLKPGITGLAQIRGHRGATDEKRDLTDRLAADLEYIAGWSLWGDAWIVVRTLGVVAHPRAF